jgi:hypothetical protein
LFFVFHGETNERTKRSVECKKPKRRKKKYFQNIAAFSETGFSFEAKIERMSAFKVREIE